MNTTARAIILMGVVAVASGCYESAEITEFEPGVYKGHSDSLLTADASERATALKERFMTVQTDR